MPGKLRIIFPDGREYIRNVGDERDLVRTAARAVRAVTDDLVACLPSDVEVEEDRIVLTFACNDVIFIYEGDDIEEDEVEDILGLIEISAG